MLGTQGPDNNTQPQSSKDLKLAACSYHEILELNVHIYPGKDEHTYLKFDLILFLKTAEG